MKRHFCYTYNLKFCREFCIVHIFVEYLGSVVLISVIYIVDPLV